MVPNEVLRRANLRQPGRLFGRGEQHITKARTEWSGWTLLKLTKTMVCTSMQKGKSDPKRRAYAISSAPCRANKAGIQRVACRGYIPLEIWT